MNKSLNDYQAISFDPGMYKDFDGEQAHRLGALISSAYDRFEKQQPNWSLPNGYDLIKELKHRHNRMSFGCVAKKGQDAFIIIRGTRTSFEWLNNLKINYENYISVDGKDWGETHSGFFSIYDNIREDIRTVSDQLKECDHIFVAGHSLGGALATLAIPDLLGLEIDADKITVYTFASPRSGDRAFATRFKESGVKHWRIANTEDIVPTLPGATANIISPLPEPTSQEDPEIVKYFKNLKLRGMKTFEHTGTPIYFTIGTDSWQDNHNLETIYMKGISQQSATVLNQPNELKASPIPV